MLFVYAGLGTVDVGYMDKFLAALRSTLKGHSTIVRLRGLDLEAPLQNGVAATSLQTECRWPSRAVAQKRKNAGLRTRFSGSTLAV